jgi:hypothetical protein
MSKKIDISMYWDTSEYRDVNGNLAHEAKVSLSEDTSYESTELLIFYSESAAHRMEIDSNRMVVSSEYRPGYISLFDSPREQLPNGHSANSFTPANHIDNLPDNYDGFYNTYTYAMEINDGVITIYSDLDDNLKINISTKDFKIFHKAYTHVRMTHQPIDFSVTIW